MKSGKMRTISAEEIKSISLNGLKNVANYCDSKGLRYYLGYGTLLGAVRHKGFIPWDDDIDIWMPRPDYDKFIKDYRNDAEWEVISQENQPMYFNEFAKLCKKDTIITPNRFHNDFLYGLSIDLFPLDSINYTEQKEEFIISFFDTFEYYAKKINFYCMKRNNTSTIKRIIKRNISLITNTLYKNNVHELYKEWSDLLRRFNYDETIWLSSFINDKKAYKREWFDVGCKLEFEGVLFTAPINYHDVLKEKYGNYMELPPVRERIPKHDYIAYELEK